MNRLQRNQKGFTLIELLVVIAILIVIFAFGLTVNLNAFRGDNFLAEEAKIVSAIEKARSRAMANMFDTTHGFCYDSTTKNYVIFRGNTCTITSTSELIPANTNIADNVATTFTTFVFSRLAGNTTGASIHITDGFKSADIIINNEGTINW